MNRQGRILVVDDLEKWREQLVETLQHSGFYADSVATVTEVLERLDKALYHLLLLDVRLVDADPNNQEGIDLLAEMERRGLSEAIKVIILSAYRTQQRMRTAFKEYRVSDFLSKDEFNRKVLLDSVQQIFAKEISINLALEVHWQQISGPEQAVLNLEVGGTRIRRSSPAQSRMASELDDLLCRLFHRSKSVLVCPISSGKSTTGVLWAQPFYSSGGGARAVAVKFGDFHKIEEEFHNFKEYVQPFIGGGRSTAVLDVQRTPHLGGIMYTFLGADDDHLEDFGSFYRHADVPQIQSVLDDLFLNTCSTWYANTGHLKPYDLTVEYQGTLEFTLEKLEHALGELQKFVQGRQRLTFKSLNSDRVFTNPLLGMTGQTFVFPTYTCTTHGDFNQHNLLVDATEHTWLIDFQSTGSGHILRDVAQLDSEIRFFLLAPEEATLDERLQMEEALCSAERFSQVRQLANRFSTENAALAKAYATVVHLRSLARKLVVQNPSDDISEYYIALFYNAINTIRFYSLSARQREHALLCGSLLADWLGLKG
jgi:CheY-like chemotaxis protein